MRYYGSQDNNDDHDDGDENMFEENEFSEPMDDENFDDFEEEYYMQQKYQVQDNIKLAELALVEANLNRRILLNAIRMLEKSFFWRFYSHTTKLKMIQETYRVFYDLLEEKEEPEGKEFLD